MDSLITDDLAARLEAARGTPAWRSYTHARDCVLRMKALEAQRLAGEGRPSSYWVEELAGFEYMLDASPLIVEKLRHHTFHVTGLKVYDYRTHKDKFRAQLSRKLAALVKGGGDGLLVPEARALGGFGFDIDGKLINLDTLKYFEVLLALNRGGVLTEFGQASARKIVWEIGSGWGGLAYHFKTKCPNVTYVMSDLPELYLFSATYLMTVFPDASFRFYGEVPDEELLDGLEEVDFLMLPHTRLDLVPEANLTMNTVSFQEMTTGQVEAYVRRAYELGCPYLYSLNRERSLYNPQLLGVRRILERWYWPHEVEVLPVSYVHMLDGVPDVPREKRAKLKAKAVAAGKKVASKEDLDYKHLVGWRRLKP